MMLAGARELCYARGTTRDHRRGKSARLVARWLLDGARDETGRREIECDGPRRLSRLRGWGRALRLVRVSTGMECC